MTRILLATVLLPGLSSWTAADEPTSPKAIFDKALAMARTIEDVATRGGTKAAEIRHS